MLPILPYCLSQDDPQKGVTYKNKLYPILELLKYIITFINELVIPKPLSMAGMSILQ